MLRTDEIWRVIRWYCRRRRIIIETINEYDSEFQILSRFDVTIRVSNLMEGWRNVDFISYVDSIDSLLDRKRIYRKTLN